MSSSLDARGLAGFVFRVNADEHGLPGAHGRSLPDEGQGFQGTVPLYLNSPEVAQRNAAEPTVRDAGLVVTEGTCGQVATGSIPGVISFETDVRGRWHYVCDLDGDGVFTNGGADLHRAGAATPGTNGVSWWGRDQRGESVDPGTYDCRVGVAVGELHYVAKDLETAYPGFGLYRDGPTPTPLRMYWDDSDVAVQGERFPPPDDAVEPPVTSGLEGLLSAPWGSLYDPGQNSRAWGDFRPGSRGNEAWLDTWTAAAIAWSEPFEVVVIDGEADADLDELPDAVEDCVSGTDPNNPDSDEDGLSDWIEVEISPTDPNDPDTDDDCVPDADEVDAEGRAGDRDGDGTPDPLDDDDDGDGIPSCEEVREGDDNDLDGDGQPNHLDLDSDGDEYGDRREGTADRDLDGWPDFLDADTVGVGNVVGPTRFTGGCAVGGAGLPAGGLVLLGLLLGRRRRA